MTIETYAAVVETGSCDPTYTRYEERENCGHKHRTYDAAESCRQKKMNWSKDGRNCSALWFNSTIHNQDGARVGR